MTMKWQPTDSIVLLTCLLEQIQKLAIQAGIPYTDKQILEKCLVLVRATYNFKYTLT